MKIIKRTKVVGRVAQFFDPSGGARIKQLISSMSQKGVGIIQGTLNKNHIILTWGKNMEKVSLELELLSFEHLIKSVAERKVQIGISS